MSKSPDSITSCLAIASDVMSFSYLVQPKQGSNALERKKKKLDQITPLPDLQFHEVLGEIPFVLDIRHDLAAHTLDVSVKRQLEVFQPAHAVEQHVPASSLVRASALAISLSEA